MFLTTAATATTISIGDTSLSLSNFQLITELSVPLGCLLAYNNPIQGCEATDFDSTRTCSARCAGQHATWSGTGGKSGQLALRRHKATNVVAGTDRQAQHNHGVCTAFDQRRQASASASAAAATAIYYLCHSTSTTTNYNVGDSNSNTNAASSTSSTTTTIDYSSAAGHHSGTAADNHCHFYNPDRKPTSTSEHFYEASG
ncbi:heterokaryon incompatibility protein [Colletotrichum incanum]|uniref:Heterokaryon incompatibility protein n=1 Tax=Colletotrichum incanum TaxID=1573173 RepID=A0A162NBY6_COLIC|nr:heterokaryon incompatibility protein [Colletotrichum incanum]